jgi:non-ribosomal peptide synthetase component F
MRNYPGDEKSYEEFLKEVARHSIDALENQDFQFEELVEKLELKRDLSRNPLFDVTMVVQNFKGIENGKLPVQEAVKGFNGKTAKFDLTFFIQENQSDIYITIEYYASIFKKETIQRLAGHFKNIIKAVIQEPTIQLKDI